MAPPSSALATSVQVALRIRPTTPQDATSIPARFQRTVIHAVSNQAVSVDPTPSALSAGGSAPSASAASTSASAKKQSFAFDQVYSPEASQHDLFLGTAEPLISRFLEGFNCTILAYGQTSSGKTYSMTGVNLDADPTDPHNGMGIIPRSVSTIFTRAREMKEQRGSSWSYNIKGSFIELYNEDLIDLLNIDDASGGRREVQIREDKDGHIIWGGLREVAVKNANEVMGLILQGTAIRRTNETDMNAQSSRSHAIFSLTLTQRKFTGSGLPPRSSTPLPPGGRSPSRLARPVSTFNHGGAPAGSSRVSSPTFGRPATPSFATAMSRGGGLRPASSLGTHLTDGRVRITDEDAGEWITIVSKFHFVDLAGSERLKRTAAVGDRIKEGISINSGLLALGNVISALGDPARAKSHTASHVPYRDSKLTRLLQDSLGGNAHTLMIACVSPAEWNAGETVNTLKYANRARNIKNRAVITGKEEGWDDVDWLQNMVMRLRKDVKALKEGGAVSTNLGDTEPTEREGSSKKVLNQMVELQGNYESLRLKFVERTEELTRLRRELGERQRNSGGTAGGTGKYEEIVGPVIEEYEKTISAMEAELGLNRAALRLTNDLVEEKEQELSEIIERHAATEMYVEELKSRVFKLSERETATEAYIRDLEEKIKHHEETSMSSSESVSDLKRELARHKEAEGRSVHYIAELENRLTRSDESVLSLRQTIESLEKEGEIRREEVQSLRTQMENLVNDGEAWRTDLEQREKKLKELEAQMETWDAKKRAASEERIRLGNMVNDVEEARKNLEEDAPKAGLAYVSDSPNGSMPSSKSPSKENLSMESQLLALRETHAATLADLSTVTSKYRDALREISDLASQIQEAKLNTPPRSESPERLPEPPPYRRRMTGGRSRENSDGQIQLLSSGKRPFFRQAASTESLHSRSQSQSQSLSQELFSARSRKRSFPDINGSPVSSNGSHSAGPSPRQAFLTRMDRPNLSISLPIGHNMANERSVASLEKEIMRLQEVLKEREADIVVLESTLREKDKPDIFAPLSEAPERPVVNDNSLPQELSPQARDHFAAIRRSMELRHPIPDNESEADDSIDRLNELMLSMAQKESKHREVVEELNEQLTIVRRQHDELSKLSRDQAHNMSTELEALRVRHDEAHMELETLRQQEETLLAQLALTEQQHSGTVESMRQQHEQALRDREVEVATMVDHLKGEHEQSNMVLQNQLAEAAAVLAQRQHEHEETFGKLKAGHEEELRCLKQDVDETLASLKAEHEVMLSKAHAEHEEDTKVKHEEHLTTLQRTEEEYYVALNNLRSDHAEALLKQETESAVAIQRLHEGQASRMKMAEIAREGSLSESQMAQAVLLQQLQDEHTSSLDKQAALFSEDLRKGQEEHASILESERERHSGKLAKLKSDHATRLAMLQDEHSDFVERLKTKQLSDLAAVEEQKNGEIKALQEVLSDSQRDVETSSLRHQQEVEDAIRIAEEKHVAVLREIERAHEEEISQLKAEHDRSRSQADASQEESSGRLQKEHTDEIQMLKLQHEDELTRLKADHGRSRSQTDVALMESTRKLQKDHADAIQVVRTQHEEGLASLKADHDRSRSQADAALEEVTSRLQKEHADELLKLRSERQQADAEIQASIITVQEHHRQEMEEARAAFESLLAEEKAHLSQSLAQLGEVHAAECDTLRKDHDLLVDELMSYKSAADDFTFSREQIRQAHESELKEKTETITGLEKRLRTADDERSSFISQLQQLQAALEKSRAENATLIQETSRHNSIEEELEKHRSLLHEVQDDLQRTKDQRDGLVAEKKKQEALVRELQNKQESAVRELQSQLARTMESHTPTRPSQERNASFSRVNGASPTKLPPITPPPSVPPPPAPRSIPAVPSDVSSSHGSIVRSSSSSKESTAESVTTSPVTSAATSLANVTAVDSKATMQIEEQARQLEEQEAMIKTLEKQLTHCEGDLQAHMELAASLEASLADSEKNLRKARMSATELARERDTSNSQLERMRNELDGARRDADSVRRSITEEKQSLELRLEEERRARERARQQLESRVDALQRRKSKFVCM